MHKLRKALALLLVLCALLCALPAPVWASEETAEAVTEQEEPAAEAETAEPTQQDPSEPVSDAEPETEPMEAEEPEDVTGPDAEPVTEPAAEAEPETEAGPAAESEPATQAEPETEAEPAAEAEPATQAEPETEPETEAEPVTEPATEAPAPEIAPRRAGVMAGTSTKTAGAVTLGEQVEASFALGSGAVKDYYKLTLAESGTVSIQGASEVSPMTLTLLNSKGASVWSQEKIKLNTPTKLDLTAGTFYLVFSKDSDDYGTYSFTVAFTSAGETLAEKDGGSNNTQEKASALSTGARTVGQFSLTDDVDWYTFTLSKPGRLTFASATALESIYFELTDAKGNTILSETGEKDHVTGQNKLNKSLDVTAGTYYLYVEQTGDTGIYIFQINYAAVTETYQDAPGGSNNTFARASVLASNTTYEGQLAENDKTDLFKFTISDNKASVQLLATNNLPKVSYCIYNSSKTLLKTFDSAWVSASSPGKLDETVPLSKGTYYLKVMSSGGYTGTYSFQLKSTSLFVPVISSVSVENGSILAQWDSFGAPKYRVFVKTTGKWKAVGDTTGTSIRFTKPKSGTKYTFTVRALSKDGKSYLTGYDSKGKSVTYIAPPEITKLTNVNAGVKVTWKAEPGAEKYRVYYREPKGKWTEAGDTAGKALTVKKLKGGTTYDFTVRAISADGKSFTSGLDDKGKTHLYLAPPKLVSVDVQNDGILVKWNKQDGAELYRVFYKTGSGKWIKLSETKQDNLLVKNLAQGKQYVFTVRCMDAKAKQYTSGYDSKGLAATYLATPNVKSLTLTSKGVMVKWGAIPGAAKYRVYSKTGKEDFKAFATVSGTSYEATGLKAKTEYTFMIRCVTADGKNYTSGYNTKGISIKTK